MIILITWIGPTTLGLSLMSSSQNLQPENAENADSAEDVSIPTLSSDWKLNFIESDQSDVYFK